MMLQLIFLSILLIFGGRFVEGAFSKKEVPRKTIKEQVVVEKTTEPKVNGAKIEVKVDIKPTPSATVVPSGDLSNFRYPNSKTISSSSNSLTLESTDGSEKITNWYKGKLSEKDMNVKTFVTTKANDKIENKLVAANGDAKVEIEITGNEGSALMIKVVLSSN